MVPRSFPQLLRTMKAESRVFTYVKKLIKILDILTRIPVSRATLYNMIAAGKFPRPIHLGGSGSFWPEDEVDAWIEAQIEVERAA